MRTFWQDLYRQAVDDLEGKNRQERIRLAMLAPGASSFYMRMFWDECNKVRWLKSWADIEKSGEIEALRKNSA